MKLKKFTKSFTILAFASALGGCVNVHREGVYLPENSQMHDYESAARFVLLEDTTQDFVTQAGGIKEEFTEDGRLQVTAGIRNRKNFPVRVQVACQFRDADGFAINDKSPFSSVLIDANATEYVQFAAMSLDARLYTIQVRRPR